MKVETNLQHSWTAKFETHNILINGKGVWFPLETDLNGDILITQGDDKDYIDPDEIGAIYQYTRFFTISPNKNNPNSRNQVSGAKINKIMKRCLPMNQVGDLLFSKNQFCEI